MYSMPGKSNVCEGRGAGIYSCAEGDSPNFNPYKFSEERNYEYKKTNSMYRIGL